MKAYAQIGQAKQSKTKQFRCGVRLKNISGGYDKTYVEEPFVFVSATLPALEAKLAAIRGAVMFGHRGAEAQR